MRHLVQHLGQGVLQQGKILRLDVPQGTEGILEAQVTMALLSWGYPHDFEKGPLPCAETFQKPSQEAVASLANILSNMRNFYGH